MIRSLILILAILIAATACGPRRMAPFAPHRTNTDFHHEAKANHACVGCHEVRSIGQGHQASDDCLKCHRIVQGE